MRIRTLARKTIFLAMAATLGIAAAQTNISDASGDTPAVPGAFAPTVPDASTTQPLTFAGRMHWAFHSTFGPLPVFTTFVEAGIQTGTDTPVEWGSHWNGFADRVGSKFAQTAVRSTVEGSLGALWGEDPRYHRMGEGPTGKRIWYAIKMTVLADRVNGGTMPAFARIIAIPGARVLSNEWRPPSQVDPRSTADGIALSFVRRTGSNAFLEFWPDIRRRLPHGH